MGKQPPRILVAGTERNPDESSSMTKYPQSVGLKKKYI